MNNDEKQKLIDDFEKAINEIRVLRYTSPDEELKGFRVLFVAFMLLAATKMKMVMLDMTSIGMVKGIKMGMKLR